MGGRFGELALILLIIIILFGAGKLPKVMGDIGRGIRSLREGMQDKGDDNDDVNDVSK